MLSSKNPRLQLARELAKNAKDRATHELFLIEGPKLVREALAAGLVFREVFVSPGLATRPGGAALAGDLERKEILLHEIKQKDLEKISAMEAAQGIVAVAEIPKRGGPESLLVGTGDLLLAATVQDPGNAGALARIAAAAGFSALVADKQTADFFSPKAVRGSAGSVLRLPCWRVEDLGAFAESLAKAKVGVLAASPRGGADPAKAELPARVALVVGGEGRGIPDRLAAACTGSLTIPMAPGVESLNVAAAAAVLAFEIKKRRA